MKNTIFSLFVVFLFSFQLVIAGSVLTGFTVKENPDENIISVNGSCYINCDPNISDACVEVECKVKEIGFLTRIWQYFGSFFVCA